MFRNDCRTCAHCEYRPKEKDRLGSLKHISEYYCTEIQMQMLYGTVYSGICRRYSSNKIYNIYVKLLRALVGKSSMGCMTCKYCDYRPNGKKHSEYYCNKIKEQLSENVICYSSTCPDYKDNNIENLYV